MARMARVVVPNYPHHITQRGVRSMTVFADDVDRDTYLRFMRQETERLDVEVLAWCLMTNHVHLVVLPHRDGTLARAVGNAHRRYTLTKNRAEGVKGYLFQGRFASCVLDERHMLAAARYVELNPVRAGMVNQPEDYPWSSARFHLDLVKLDPLVRDRTLMGLVAHWPQLLAATDETMEKELRRSTRTGRPAGDGSFFHVLEGLTGRRLRKLTPGKPPRTKHPN